MPKPDPHSVALITCETDERAVRELAETPDSKLVERLARGESQIEQLSAWAVSAAEQGMMVAIAQGQILEILFRRHEGEFAKWLSLQTRADGKPLMSESTALRWRGLWKERDQIFPPDGSEPTCRARTKAYIKLEYLPEPEQSERDPAQSAPAFRVSCKLPTQAPDSLPPAIRREVLTKLEQPAIYYLRCLDHAQRIALIAKLEAA